LPSLALEKFYNADAATGVDLEIIPDLTYQKNSKLIASTKEIWDEISENDSKF